MGTGYPTATCTDGSTVAWAAEYVWPTGPNSFVMLEPGTTSTAVTLGPSTAYPAAPTSITLNPSTCIMMAGNGSSIPYEIPAIISAQLGANVYYNIPELASDDFIYAAAQKALAYTNPSQTVYVELCDELWNYYHPRDINEYLSRWMASTGGTATTWLWGILRIGQIGTIFREVFGESSQPDLHGTRTMDHEYRGLRCSYNSY